MQYVTARIPLLLTAGLLLGLAGRACAHPNREGDCSRCHDRERGDFNILGYDSLTDGLKTFEVSAGELATFSFDVIDDHGGDKYGICPSST